MHNLSFELYLSRVEENRTVRESMEKYDPFGDEPVSLLEVLKSFLALFHPMMLVMWGPEIVKSIWHHKIDN